MHISKICQKIKETYITRYAVCIAHGTGRRDKNNSQKKKNFFFPWPAAYGCELGTPLILGEEP